MKINEVAKLCGVTVRALHYYDKIGLLKPKSVGDNGYRDYGDEELETLQQILFFKELDFPLSMIKTIMDDPEYDKREALQKQRELLRLKKQHIEQLMILVDDTLAGKKDISFLQFDNKEMERMRDQYAKEVKEKYEHTEAYQEYKEKTKSYDDKKWQMTDENMAVVLKKFGQSRDLPPESEKAQALVKEWQDYITEHFYHCTKEILAGLGMMYTADERFTKNIDQYGAGTAKFMEQAIAIYCKDK